MIHTTTMRTNIEIDDGLMERALRATGLPTKRAAVEAGLRLLVRLEEQREILGLAGQVRWEGDLDASRLGRGEDRGAGGGEGPRG
jgi:Arc/MetJ family transcription regulator